jgi:hypothetical protein
MSPVQPVRSGPLSAAQEFEWLKAAWEAPRDTDVQHIRFFEVALPAGTTVSAAVAAVTALVHRHEALRTGIPPAGAPVQSVYPPAPPIIAGCETGADVTEFVHRLKLACRAVADGPMLRVGLVHSGEWADRVCFTLPHTLTDRSSEDTLTRELVDLLAGRALPEPPSQQLDPVHGDRPGGGTRRYWAGVVAGMPSRLFPPEREGRFRPMDARFTSGRMPALLTAAARSYAVPPAVVFEAMLQLAVALAAGSDRTVVRSHFLGRGPAQRDAVGCFAKVIPSVVDLTGEPSLGTLIARTARARLRAQRHSGISYLALRETMMAEELRRGTVFAEGVTVNFIEDESAQRLRALEDGQLRELAARPAPTDMWLLPEEPARPDLCGFDAYLNTFIGDGALKIEACFNRDSVSREQAETLLRTPERVLSRALMNGDLTWSDMLAPAPEPASGAPLRSLLTAVDEVCRPEAPARPNLSYLQNGGTLDRLPILVRRLASAGLDELTVHDFLRPVTLGELVGQRAPAAPPELIFRWALWNAGPDSIRMLRHSIGTFRHFFGTDARYIVHTDAVSELAAGPFEVAPIITADPRYYEQRAIDGRVHVPWLKWAPRMRLNPAATEIYVDSDVFLLAEPTELRGFVRGNGTDFLVTQEEKTDRLYYGNFAARLDEPITPINTGLLGQRPGADLSAEFDAAYRWWQTRVPPDEVSYFDEQGAVLWSLRHALADNRVTLLDPQRYRVVCDRNTPPVETVDGLVALHATFGPVHPAYRRFLAEISAVSGVPADTSRGKQWTHLSTSTSA